MKQQSFVTICVCTVALALFVALGRQAPTRAADAPAGPVYAQLSSPDSQMPAGGPLMVKMTSNDALGGILFTALHHHVHEFREHIALEFRIREDRSTGRCCATRHE